MNLKFLTKYKIVKQILYQNVGYYAQQCYDMSGDSFVQSDTNKPILIVARQHYSENWQTYSSLSLKELKNILQLQKKAVDNGRLIQQYVPNKEQDGFDVKTIVFSTNFISAIESNTLLIPETELIEGNADDRSVYHLITPIGEVFWAKSNNRIHSVYRQGLLNSTNSFKMSIGYPADINVVVFEQNKYLDLLKTSLINISFAQLTKVVSFEFTNIIDFKALHKMYWAPIATALAFLLMINGYLIYHKDQLEQQLLSYGDQVTELLDIKVKQDKASLFIDAINQEIKSVELVHEQWSIVYAAIKQDMHIQQFRKRDGSYVLRGLANDAAKVLSAVNDLPQVSSAVFQGIVRKSRGRDSFIIELKLKALKTKDIIVGVT